MKHNPNWGQACERILAITPHDTNPLAASIRAIRCTGAGNVTFKSPDGVYTSVAAFAAGETRPISAGWVLATGTTATGIEGMV